jgi:hypothetical protein
MPAANRRRSARCVSMIRPITSVVIEESVARCRADPPGSLQQPQVNDAEPSRCGDSCGDLCARPGVHLPLCGVDETLGRDNDVEAKQDHYALADFRRQLLFRFHPRHCGNWRGSQLYHRSA